MRRWCCPLRDRLDPSPRARARRSNRGRRARASSGPGRRVTTRAEPDRRRHEPGLDRADGTRSDRRGRPLLSRRVRRPPRRDVPDRRDRRHAVPAAARRRRTRLAGAPAPDPGWHNAFDRVGAVRRAVVPADRRRRLPAPTTGAPRSSRSIPLAIRGAVVRARRSPVRGGDARVERRLLGALVVTYLLTTSELSERTARTTVLLMCVLPDLVLLPHALQRVAVPPARP